MCAIGKNRDQNDRGDCRQKSDQSLGRQKRAKARREARATSKRKSCHGCGGALNSDDQFCEDAICGLRSSAMSITLACPSPVRLAPRSAFSAAAMRSFGTAPVESFHAAERVDSRQPAPMDNLTRVWPPEGLCKICKSLTALIARCATVLAPRASVLGRSTANFPPA